MEIFMTSIELMVIGMGVTFIFLIIMVFVMGGLQKFVAVLDKYFPVEQPKAQASAKSKIALAIAVARHHAK